MSDIFSQLKALPPQERQKILAAMPKAEAEEVYKILEELDVRELREETSKDFMKFVGEVWPDFIHGSV
jgi:Mg/Co/Ni transporter MgtE